MFKYKADDYYYRDYGPDKPKLPKLMYKLLGRL